MYPRNLYFNESCDPVGLLLRRQGAADFGSELTFRNGRATLLAGQSHEALYQTGRENADGESKLPNIGGNDSRIDCSIVGYFHFHDDL
jgi:hypothetical protein